MAKFIWNADVIRKFNINHIGDFGIEFVKDDNVPFCVTGYILAPGINPSKQTFLKCSTFDEAKQFIDEITTTDFDKIGQPIMNLFMDYVKNAMLDRGGSHD